MRVATFLPICIAEHACLQTSVVAFVILPDRLSYTQAAFPLDPVKWTSSLNPADLLGTVPAIPDTLWLMYTLGAFPYSAHIFMDDKR